MKTLVVVIATVLLLCLGVQAKHTLHVDNVYPNFGETTLISGPFTADRIDPASLNVGVFTINSKDGLTITTDNTISFEGSRFDATAASNIDINAGESISIVAAATFNVASSGPLSFETDGRLQFNAIGGSEVIAHGDLNLAAGIVDLSGDFLRVTSAEGSIFFVGDNAFSNSPALNIDAQTDVDISASGTAKITARQSIESHTGDGIVEAANLFVTAVRNNILVNGNTGMNIDLADDMVVTTKGGAIFASSDGNLDFNINGNADLHASDDLQLNAVDSIVLNIAKDAIFDSSGSTYFLADHGAAYEFDHGSFVAEETIRATSTNHFMETTNGNLEIDVNAGPFNSTAVEFTTMFATQTLTFTSGDFTRLIGEQGVDMRAERGSIYFTPAGPNAPNGNTPIYLYAITDATFRASDMLMTTERFSIISNYSRFATEDTARYSEQTWTLAGDLSFDVDSFTFGSSEVAVNTEGNLVLTSEDDIHFDAYYQVGSQILIDTSFIFGDISDNDIEWFSYSNLVWRSDSSVTLSAVNNLEFSSDEAIRVIGRSTLSASCTDHFTSKTAFDSHYLSPYRGSTHNYNAADNVEFHGGYFQVQVLDSLFFDATSFYVQTSPNIELQANTEYNIVTDTFEVEADRYVIINGEQTWNTADVTINGNAFFGSPPESNLFFHVDNSAILINGNFLAHSRVLNLLPTATWVTTTENFLATTQTEGTIFWETPDINLSAFGEFHIQQHFPDFVNDLQLNFDNQFHFLTDQLSILADASIGQTLQILADDQASFYAENTDVQSDQYTVNAQTVDVIANEGQLFLDAAGLFTTHSVHTLTFSSQRSSITIGDDIDQTYISDANAVIYSYDQFFFHSIDGTDSLTISLDDSFSFQGGNLNANSNGVVTFNAANDITQHGFEGITVSSLSTLDLNANLELRLTSPTVKFLADLDITVIGDTLTTTSAQGELITLKTTAAGGFLDLNAGDDLVFWSNDEFLVNAQSFSITATGTSPVDADSIFIKSSFQDGGIISYAGGQFSVDTQTGSSFYHGVDDSITGGNVEFSSVASSFTTTGAVNGGILLIAEGSNYDEDLDRFIGILHRSLNGNINVQSQADGVFLANQILEIHSTGDAVTHQANVAGISLVSSIGGFIAQSANDFSVQTQGGAISNLLSGYSLWKASDLISTSSECDVQATSSAGNIHVLADRGQVRFSYLGNAIQTFTGATWNAEGADQFFWQVNGNILGDGSLVDIYADADISILSDATVATNQGIEITSGRNSVYKSSNNNGISFDTVGGTVTLTATAGWISQVASGSMVWHGEGDNIFTGVTQTLTTLGSIRGSFTESLTLAAASDFSAFARNTIGFEAVNSITIGTIGNSIITINTGGDTLDNGVFIDVNSGLTRFHSDVNVNIVANQYFQESDESSSIIVNQLLVESQGTDSIGKDITVNSAFDMSLNSEGSITLTGASVRYLYDNELGFSGVNLKIDSSTFIDLQSADQLKFSETGTWTLNSNALSFFTYGDSKWTAAGTSTISTTQTISTTSDKNTVFTATGSAAAPAGVVNFQTNLGNSPITFETQHPTGDFTVETTTGGISATTVSKISITGKNGINSFSKTTTSFTAADEFSVDSTGDVRLLAEGLGNDISITGTDPSGSGSKISLSSTGNVQGHFFSVTLSARDQNWLPDEDLTFEGIQTSDLGGKFTISTTDDLTGDIGGSWIYHTALATFSAAETIDYQAFGLEAERGFAMSFSSLASNIQALANDGSIYFTPSTGLYLTGNSNTLQASKQATYNTINDQIFTVSEDPTNIQITIGDSLLLGAKDIALSATGDEPTSGVISVTANGFNINTAYPSGTDSFGVAFIAGNTLDFDASDSRFVMKNMQFGDIVPSADGSVLFQASGYDEFGRGIEIDSGNILITSEVNVVLRAANVNFLELPHDPYQGSAISESGKYLEALGIDFKLTRHRPTILTVDDQVYTSLGRNINGNGIELTSTVPGADIVFTVETVNVNSDATASFLANSLVKMTSFYDTQIVSLKSVNINAHGTSSNPPDWVDSIHVRVGARDQVAFNPIGALIGFTPKRDLFMNSFDLLEALVTDSLDITGAGMNFNIVAETEFNLNTVTGSYSTDATMTFNSGDNIRVLAENQLSITTLQNLNIGQAGTFDNTVAYHDGRSDVYFSFDQESGQATAGAEVSVTASSVRFFAPLVDIESTTSLVFPIFLANQPCFPGRFYLREFNNLGNQEAYICYCPTNVPVGTPICYRLFKD